MSATVIKVIIPKDVAGAIEKLRDCGETNRELLGLLFEERVRSDVRPEMVIWSWADRNRDEYIQAIVNGYEVEKTPHDLVKEFFETERELQRNSMNGQGSMNTGAAIQRTLNILGISIEGVNS